MKQRILRGGYKAGGRLQILTIATIIVMSIAANLVAGVLVAPTVVILTDKNRTGRLTLQNPSNSPAEVTVFFGFGLPESDSLGNVTMTLQDSNVTDERSAMGWVKAFPRKIILPPSGSQVVRIIASPPTGLADGEYWARIVVRAQEGKSAEPAATESNQISTKLNLVTQTAIMLKYRKGSLNSELQLVKGFAQLANGKVWVTADMLNRGNASYIGILKCRLFDSDNNEIGSNQIDLAVYRRLRRVIPINSDKKAMPYRVEISIGTDGRTDIAPEDIIAGNKITVVARVE